MLGEPQRGASDLLSTSLFLWLALVSQGCTVGSATFHAAATTNFANTDVPEKTLVSPGPAITRKIGAVLSAAPPDMSCELRMFIEQQPNGRFDGIGKGKLGAVIVERLSDGRLTNGVCIKRPGQKLAVPSAMLIAKASDGPSLERFCRDDEATYTFLLPEAANTAEIPVAACTWNGIFHSARPFTVTLMTARDGSVGDYVEFLRIYRNGDLMAAWNYVSDQPTQNEVIIPGQSLTTGLFAMTHPPHLSAMDIRIIPRTDGVAQTVDTTTRNDWQRFETELKTASGAALDAFLPPNSADRKSFNCLTEYVRASSRQIMRVVNGDVVSLPPACSVLTGAPAPPGGPAGPSPTPLSDEYAHLKDQSRASVEKLRDQAYADIEKAKQDVLAQLTAKQREFVEEFVSNVTKTGTPAAIKRAVEECQKELIDGDRSAQCKTALKTLDPAVAQKYDDLVKSVGILDHDVQSVLGTADEARLLAEDLSSKAKSVASNPEKQAQVFNAFAQSLSAQGDSFEPRRDNPPLLAGEQKIDLEYSDKFQFFMLAPWNGVPIHVNGSAQADFNAAVAIPLVDVGGMRYQWAKSRFADLRAAFGIGFVETDLGNGTKQAAALPNVSLGFGNLKVGAGIATGQGLGDTSNRMRFIVGADLYKLISGSNLELL